MFDDETDNTGAAVADETPAAMPADDAAVTTEPTTEGAGSDDSAAV